MTNMKEKALDLAAKLSKLEMDIPSLCISTGGNTQDMAIALALEPHIHSALIAAYNEGVEDAAQQSIDYVDHAGNYECEHGISPTHCEADYCNERLGYQIYNKIRSLKQKETP